MEENTVHKEVMRFKTLDMDLVNTDNWLADFKIISGNEAGYFSITTDHKTNEGILVINKVKDAFVRTEYVKVSMDDVTKQDALSLNM